ncbi:metallophosphoesterase family protein [Saccharibacillus alkalitolerans]|uniref:Serine/threonine protein phosphatase n=1 Tax=Saccharibacillus alkalitolerans TaxID=2705290 RepID=A0ABX0FB40_9BACL|nr:metallophosphoesterase family protein [Saccharibacillus alkalitolerans]NGZ77600.1 serine/threonine protein phosphatase [Saccharibacillus alkalitolerans]
MKKRTLAISDIHGELDLFERLLDKTGYDPASDQLVLLGDYIDRGPQSMRTLERVMELRAAGAVALMGNHEDLMLRALVNGGEEDWKRWVVRNGGCATLESYGFADRELRIETGEAFRRPELKSEALARHLDFARGLDRYYETEHVVFVHAGIQPGKTAAESDPSELLWIREEFHLGYGGAKTVVFGHTPTRLLHRDPDNDGLYYGSNRIIGIDGGAVFGGQLNALSVENGEVFYVKSESSS